MYYQTIKSKEWYFRSKRSEQWCKRVIRFIGNFAGLDDFYWTIRTMVIESKNIAKSPLLQHLVGHTVAFDNGGCFDRVCTSTSVKRIWCTKVSVNKTPPGIFNTIEKYLDHDDDIKICCDSSLMTNSYVLHCVSTFRIRLQNAFVCLKHNNQKIYINTIRVLEIYIFRLSFHWVHVPLRTVFRFHCTTMICRHIFVEKSIFTDSKQIIYRKRFTSSGPPITSI